MTKVLQFPTKEVRVCNLEIEMDDHINKIEDAYEILEKLHESIHLMEKEAATLEREFDRSLGVYAGFVGKDNIPVMYLDYSSNVTATLNEAGEIEFEYEYKEEKEIVSKLKDAVLESWENGDTIFDIAEEFNTTPEAVMRLLGLEGDLF